MFYMLFKSLIYHISNPGFTYQVKPRLDLYSSIVQCMLLEITPLVLQIKKKYISDVDVIRIVEAHLGHNVVLRIGLKLQRFQC